MNMRYFPAIVKRPNTHLICNMSVVFLVLSALFVSSIPLADASPDALIIVDPPSVTGYLPGDSFDVDLYIMDADAVHAWEVKLLFSKDVLHVIEFIEGDFLEEGGFTTFYPYIDNPTGYASCAATGDAEHYGVWGEGILATVVFEVMGGGNSPIDIFETTLLDRDKNPLPQFDPEDGYFQGMAPYAKFTHSPNPVDDGYCPAVNQTVTFDASDSYDPDGTIVSYHWDFYDGTTNTTTSPTTTHIFTEIGAYPTPTYPVNLTVTDNDGYNAWYTKLIDIILRDIAVTSLDVSPQNLVRPEYLVEINVTVHNYGTLKEAYNLATYYDDTLIDEVSRPGVYSGNSETLTFNLDTTGFASDTYIIKANVTSVFPGDNNMTNNELTSPLTISLLGLPPVASFTWSPLEPMVSEEVTFTSTSTDPDGTIVSWEWDFNGDGVTDRTTEITTWTYTTAGTYTVTLTVTDDDGLTDASQHVVIIVEELPNIYVHPEVTTSEQYETFEIEVRISGAVDVFAWEFWLSWNASILNFTGIEEGGFLTGFEQAPTYFVNVTYQDEEGLDYIGVACTLLGPDTPGVSGPGILATVTFLAEREGETILDLFDVELRDSFITPIEHTVQDGYATVSPPRVLTVKLTGEHDYLLRENVKIRLAALVKDGATTEPVSDADVAIQIYDPDGALWVSDMMVERLVGTGIYEWESAETIRKLRLEKGVYLVHVTVSSEGSLTTSDILAFHIDPPGEDPMQLHWILLFILAAALATTVSVWYTDHRRLTRKLPELQKRMYYPSNFPFF